VVTKPLSLALALAFCLDAGAADPFATATLSPPPPPQQRAAAARLPAAVPAMPPLPFRYVGRLLDKGKREVLLMRGEHLFSIAAGDKIGDEYLVDHVGDSSIRFTYLPLKMKQNMQLPGVN
jgi:hypothetical protein